MAPPPITPPAFDVAELFDLPAHSYVLGFVANGGPAAAADIVAAHHAIHEAPVLVLVGDVERTGGRAVSAGEGVQVLGALPPGAIQALAADAALVVLAGSGAPLRLATGLCMQAGACILVSDDPASMAYCDTLAVGYRVEDGALGLARLLGFLSQPEVRAEYGRLARERAATVLRWDACVTTHMAAYQGTPAEAAAELAPEPAQQSDRRAA